jgi:hypothetical protein
MESPEEQTPPLRRAARSASAEASKQAEFERVGKMSVTERIHAALEMRERFEDLRPVRRSKE